MKSIKKLTCLLCIYFVFVITIRSEIKSPSDISSFSFAWKHIEKLCIGRSFNDLKKLYPSATEVAHHDYARKRTGGANITVLRINDNDVQFDYLFTNTVFAELYITLPTLKISEKYTRMNTEKFVENSAQIIQRRHPHPGNYRQPFLSYVGSKYDAEFIQLQIGDSSRCVIISN